MRKLIFQEYEIFWFIRRFLVLHCKEHSQFCAACVCLDKQIKPQSVKNGMQRGSCWIMCCAALVMPLGNLGRAVAPPRVSGVCQDSQMWPTHSVLGSRTCGGKPSTPDPLGVGNHREMQGKADNHPGQHQGSVWGGLMWAVCSWCLCSHTCRWYLTHPLLISSELLVFRKALCKSPWEHNRSVSLILKNSRMCERKTGRASGDVEWL